MKILNLYSGIGGNRKLWKNCEVTAIENNAQIAKIYKSLFPKDIVIVGDAHQYLLEHYTEFDFIWSSPPCQSHSRLAYAFKVKRFPDLKLYEEIIFLSQFFKGKWSVENVRPYYQPLIPPTMETRRTIFWSDFTIRDLPDLHWPGFGHNKNEREGMMRKLKWFGFDLEFEDFKDTPRRRQIVDNCIHPAVGLQVFNCAISTSKRKL